MAEWRVEHGDCIDAMAAVPEGSVDAIVTDPPYGLGFMGRRWDALPPGLPWARECLRVLKPGGHLLAFGGTRTYHRLAVAVEDAGFEIRDCLAWLYGSGFPKSLDVGKAIDKAAGAEREVVGQRSTNRNRPATDAWGASANGKVSVAFGDGSGQLADVTAPATPDAADWQGWGTALKPAFEPIVLARKPLTGTVAANVLEHGTGALNVDGCRIEGAPRTTHADGHRSTGSGEGYGMGAYEADVPAGRWPANVALDEAAAAILDEQTGELQSGQLGPQHGRTVPRLGSNGIYGSSSDERAATREFYGDSGGASRFLYVAKADTAERNVGLVGRNPHPTVKPVTLMRWLCRLITPPGGVILDPFMGSGTTGIAALREGFSFIGIDQDADYVDVARARIIGDAPLLNTAAEMAA